MKKRNKIFLNLILFLTLILIAMYNKTYAVEEYYKDWSEFPRKIDNEYSYSTLYYSTYTKIEVLKRGKIEETWKTKEEFEVIDPIELHTGEEAIIKITNCAVDKDGDICDVIIKLDNVETWGVGSKPTENSIKLSFVDTFLHKSQKKPVIYPDDSTVRKKS